MTEENEKEEKEEKKEKKGGGEEILAGPPIEGSTRDPRRPKNGQFGTSITKQAIWHLNFFGSFSSRLLPKICWSCYICQTLNRKSSKKHSCAQQGTETHQNFMFAVDIVDGNVL